MDCLKDFTSLIEKSERINPTVQSWLYNTQELERQLSERVVYLCMYYDRIPQQFRSEYAKTLISVLNNGDIWPGFIESNKLTDNISDFAKYLESSNDPDQINQGRELRSIASL